MSATDDNPDAGDDLSRDIEPLAQLIAGARSCVVLTGAGISTESGLPDYRGTAGLWKNRRFEELANIAMFRRATDEFWEFYRARLATLREAQPNEGHRALAALEHARVIEGVVTQNVDGLHRIAGSDAVEVHGSLLEAECLSCGKRLPMHHAEQRMAADPQQVPRCDCGEPLKPAVTLFGEMLPHAAIERASAMVERCDVLLVCGSSLAVSPVNGFAWMVRSAGGTLAIVNRGPTEADDIAQLRIDAPLGAALMHLGRMLGAG